MLHATATTTDRLGIWPDLAKASQPHRPEREFAVAGRLSGCGCLVLVKPMPAGNAMLPHGADTAGRRILAAKALLTAGRTLGLIACLSRRSDGSAAPLVISDKEAIMALFLRRKVTRPRSQTLYCSFCHKSKDSVAKLIAGPGVYICNECVDLCGAILADDSTPNDWKDSPE